VYTASAGFSWRKIVAPAGKLYPLPAVTFALPISAPLPLVLATVIRSAASVLAFNATGVVDAMTRTPEMAT
jgi:hypothetical protein